MSIANRISAELKGDRVIWAIVAILALFSVLAVYSSANAWYHNPPRGIIDVDPKKQGEK